VSPEVSCRYHKDSYNWEKEVNVVLKSSDSSWKDTLVIGRKNADYYLYVKSNRQIKCTADGSGYGGKTIFEMQQKLIAKYAERGIALNIFG
jgi:hypothetical protein